MLRKCIFVLYCDHVGVQSELMTIINTLFKYKLSISGISCHVGKCLFTTLQYDSFSRWVIFSSVGL